MNISCIIYKDRYSVIVIIICLDNHVLQDENPDLHVSVLAYSIQCHMEFMATTADRDTTAAAVGADVRGNLRLPYQQTQVKGSERVRGKRRRRRRSRQKKKKTARGMQSDKRDVYTPIDSLNTQLQDRQTIRYYLRTMETDRREELDSIRGKQKTESVKQPSYSERRCKTVKQSVNSYLYS